MFSGKEFFYFSRNGAKRALRTSSAQGSSTRHAAAKMSRTTMTIFYLSRETRYIT